MSKSPVEVLNDPQRVRAVLTPLRQRILRELQRAPASASGLAPRLGMPRQKINYHVRALERVGVLELAGTEQRRGCTERLLRPTARAWLVSPALLGELSADPDVVRDRFSSSYLLEAASGVVRDVTEMQGEATRGSRRLPTFTLQVDVKFSSAQARAAFAEELSDAVARLVSRHHDDSPGSRAYRFTIGGHPVRRPDDRRRSR
jgi:DNA-binding transcriptional ArsR family regulator